MSKNDENENENKKEIEIKLVFVGETKVGKTSLINQYIKNVFHPGYISTIGSDKFIKKLILDDSKIILLVVWDTAGQERFRALNTIFLKGANIVLMVYDITNKESFEELKNYWYEIVVEKVNGNFILGIAGNKSDLYENSQVPLEEGKSYANKVNAIFSETTALNLNSIQDLINSLVKEYIDKFLKEKEKEKEINTRKQLNKEKNKEKRKKCCNNNKKK